MPILHQIEGIIKINNHNEYTYFFLGVITDLVLGLSTNG